MANTVKLKRSAVAGKTPTTGDLELGELAVNTYDGKLFLKKDNGTASIVEIGAGGGGGGSGDVVGPASATDNALARYDGTTGKLVQNSAVTVEDTGALRLNGSSSGYVGLAPAAAAGSTTYTLPSADGSSGQVLSTNGSGTLSWASKAASGANSDITSLSGLTTALTAAQGGTGQSSYTTGDLLYASGTTALSKLAGVATGNALISGGVGAAPSWGKIGLTTHVTGTLPVANGGTGVTTSTGSGSVVLSTSPTLTTPVLGTPTSGTLTSCTGLPLTTGVTGTLPTANGGTNLTSFTANGAVYATSTSALTTGTLPVASGGTGATSITANYLVKGNGTSAFAASGVYESGGNVSIGTTGTAGKLSVSAGTSATGTSAYFGNIDGTYNPYIQIKHASAGVTIYSSSTAGTASNALIFENQSVGETMRIDGFGNVGIGVTPVNDQLGVSVQTQRARFSGGANDRALLAYNFYRTGGVNTYIATDYATIYQQISGQHQWFAAPSGTAGNAITFTQAMTLAASGGLSIGNTTDAGAYTLSVGPRNTSTNDAIIRIDGGSGTGGEAILTLARGGTADAYLYSYSTAVELRVQASLPLIFRTADVERMRIDSNGNVGIGVTPSSWGASFYALQSTGYSLYSGNNSQARLSSNEYYTTQSLYRVSAAAALYQQDHGVHSWYTAPSGTAGNAISFTQAMTLDSSGNLGINTTSLNQGGFSRSLSINGSTNSGLEFQVAGTAAAYVFARSDANAGLNLTRNGNNPIVFATDGSERARIHGTGGVSIGNTTDPGAANLSVTGQISGGYNDAGTNTAAQALATYRVSKVTISAATTLTTTVPPAGALAQVIIVASGNTTRTVTFGTGFRTTSTLATGNTTGRIFVVSFVSDGTDLIETGRTTAIT